MQMISLPYPPTINHYYLRVKGRVVLSRKAKEYRRLVAVMTRSVPKMQGHLEMEMIAYPPDRRRRDLDNIQKAVWDALQHAGIYDDDAQIKMFSARMEAPILHGKILIWLKEIGQDRAKEK